MRSCFRTEKQIWRPSGETAGRFITAPSLPFHNSVASPSLNFQIPSAPPLEDRYTTKSGPYPGAIARTVGNEKRVSEDSAAVRREAPDIGGVDGRIAPDEVNEAPIRGPDLMVAVAPGPLGKNLPAVTPISVSEEHRIAGAGFVVHDLGSVR